MKRRSILLLLIAGLAYITLSSNAGGEANDRTGSTAGTGCGGTSGCHSSGANASIPVYVVLDSMGTPVTHYVPGMSYRVRITGVNATAATLPKFGYQLSAFSGSTGSGAVQAGTFTDVPSGSALNSFAPLTILGSNIALSATGTGTAGDLDTVSVGWTAPAAGTGTVNMYAVLCAADGDGVETGDIWNRKMVSFGELPPPNAVKELNSSISVVTYPNPVLSQLAISLGGTASGDYTIQIFDVSGKQMAAGKSFLEAGATTSVDMQTCAPGLYFLTINGLNVSKTVMITKQ